MLKRFFLFFFYEAIWYVQCKWQNLFYTASAVYRQFCKTFNDPLLASQRTVRDTAGSAIIYFYSQFDKKKKKRSSVSKAAQTAERCVWFEENAWQTVWIKTAIII